MKGYIYQIECLPTGKCYIGQTIDFNRRKSKHIRLLRNNMHDNPKLQNAWNKYGEQEFHFRVWEFELENIDELNRLECEYIDKYNSLNDGYNLIPGGGNPPNRQKVTNEDIVSYLCLHSKYGEGYGKTCEEFFKWAKGTASAAKRKVRFLEANIIFEKLTLKEKEEKADTLYGQIKELSLKRQLSQGGCSRAYSLSQDDYNFAFAAKELGYSYTVVANYLGVKPATVKDWFACRSRNKERTIFKNLTENEKSQLFSRVKTAELNGKPKSISSN